MSLRSSCVALLLAAPLAAQESSDTLRLAGTIGLVQTSGNSNLLTLNVGEELAWFSGAVALRQAFSTVYGRSEGETNASSWRASVRGDYRFSPALAAFARAGFDRDRFAGISRRFEEGVGLALVALDRARDRLELELGTDLVQQRTTLGVSDGFVSGRSVARYRRDFGATGSYVQQSVEFLPNLEALEDFRLNSESVLVAPLSRQFALKLSYVVRLDNLPEPGFASTDRMLTSALQITL
jgi:putative salt-induced outer membrane protein YdiY